MANDQPADASGDVPLQTLVEYFLVYLVESVIPPSSFSRGKTKISPSVAQSLFEFLSHHPPAPDSALLSGIDPEFKFSISLVRQILREAAALLHLDPRRLVPHALRAAALAQMLASGSFTDIDFIVQGRWSSLAGARPYAHPSLAHARHVSHSLYLESIPLAWSCLAYSASHSL